MSEALEARIRRHVDQIDGLAPPALDLVPHGARTSVEPGEFGDRARVTIEVPVRRSNAYRPGGRRRAVTVVLAAAAAIVLTVAGVAILSQRDDAEVMVDAPPATPGEGVRTDVNPLPIDDRPRLLYDHTDGSLTGEGWEPNVLVSATQGNLTGTARTDPDGRFVIDDVFGHCCSFGDLLAVTDGTNTAEVVRPSIEIVRIDHVNDIVAGQVEGISEGTLRIEVGTASSQPFQTDVEIIDSDWSVDLSGRFDVLDGMTASATLELEGITSRVESATGGSPWLDLGAGPSAFLRGGGWLPGQTLTIEIDRAPADAVVTDAAGSFEIELDPTDVADGTAVRASDGESEVEFVVPLLTYDSFDVETLTGSGRADVPDGSAFQAELWIGPSAGGEPTDRQAADGTVTDGAWEITFDAVPAGLVPISTNLTYNPDGSHWVYQSQFPLR